MPTNDPTVTPKMRLIIATLAAMLLSGCARNEYGIPLKKKPDLSAVQPGTPISKVRGLKKPIKKEALTQGELKGAEAWLFEWNLPNDEVNNRMFTSVVVKDGVVLGWHEETPDKWTKNPELYKAARLDTALENLAAAQARAAYTRMALGALASQNASRAAYDPMQYVNTSTFLYKPQPYTPIPFGGFGGGQAAGATPTRVYAARPNSGGLRDYNRMQPVGVVDGDKVYAVRPNSLGLRDYSRMQPIGVVDDGKVYSVRPNSGGLRDYSKMQPVGVVGQ